MDKWSADIGCWDYGKKIYLPKVSNIQEAIKLASMLASETKYSKPIESPHVVQIYKNDKVCWDYMNGSSCYRD